MGKFRRRTFNAISNSRPSSAENSLPVPDFPPGRKITGLFFEAFRMPLVIILLWAVLLAGVTAFGEDVYVWVEGQEAVERDVTLHNWYNRLDRDQLSGGGWISHYSADKRGEVSYDVAIPGDADYRFWVRANPVQSNLFYSIDDGPWREIDMSQSVERINVAADGGLDHRFIAWVDAGTVRMSAGKRRVAFRFDGGISNSGILDCFLFTDDAVWMPRGMVRPGPRPTAADTGDYIWIEGERAVSRDITRHNWFDRLDRDQFSDSAWVSHYDNSKPGMLAYEIPVKEAGNYRFWIRANPTRTGLSWRIADGNWQELNVANNIDSINVAADGALDHRFIAWIDGGTVSLPAGNQGISFRMQGGISNSGIIDCFVFTRDQAWAPRGSAKPGAASGLADDGYFAWEPDNWRPDAESVFSLQHLNEERSGQNGFVRRQGEGFVLGDGTPVRFWMVQADGLARQPRARLEWWTQRLAAYGVNMVRCGGTDFFVDWMNKRQDAFRRRLDGYHAMVAALKEQGIYLYMNHLFWNTHTPVSLPEDVFPGFSGNDQRALALLFFSDSFQDYYIRFLTELMTTRNPYTGLALADDPTVAFVEIQNESSLLFHSFNPTRLVETERALVEKMFGDWCKKHYGSLEAARREWGSERYPHTIPMYRDIGDDDLTAGRMRLYAIGHLTDADWARNQRNPKRAGDQLRFMVEAQHRFYERIAAALRDAGVKSLFSPSNWKTADERLLGALEHYTYTANDVVARNDYFGTVHPRNGNPHFYRIEVNDKYRDRSALTIPESVSALQHQLYAGYPYMITENCWNRPNRFRAEYPLLVSAYASLSGIDGWLFFSKSDDLWDSSMRVWGINDTTVLGQFPGTALMYRRGDVKTAEPVYHESLAFDDLYAFKGQAMRQADGIDDPLYAAMLSKVRQGEGKASMIDPLAFFVGKVTRSVSEQAEGSVIADLAPYIDRQSKKIRSITGELNWNYGTGIMTINTPRAQGATGFFQKSGRIELDDIIIQSNNEYGSVLVISLDGEALSRSKSILIQVATEDKSYGFTTSVDKQGIKTITRLGGYPLNVRPIDASIILKRSDLSQASALDGNGVVTDAPVGVRTGKTLQIRLPENELYTWIR